MSKSLALTPERMHNEIRAAHAETVAVLASKGIEYDRLGGALTPSRDKEEFAFVFDSVAAERDHDYGTPVYNALLPLLPQRDFSCAFLSGDLLIDDQDLGFELLQASLQLHRAVRPFRYTNELFVVYLNNLTARRAQTLHEGLMRYDPYVGRIPTTYSSRTKDWLSTTLGTRFLKLDKTFIGEHEDDVPNDENYNLPGWPLEEHGYGCVSIQSMYFGLFLNYKIERRVIPGETDTTYSLNAVSPAPADLAEFSVEMDDAKLSYIADHGGGFRSAGLASISRERVVELIRERIARNYIYSLELKEHPGGTSSLFAIMLEFAGQSAKPVRMRAAMEYVPARKALRVVTLF